MDELYVVARFTVHDGQLDGFKDAAADCVQIVRDQDTGTMLYDWYFNDDQTECVVLERYRDSDAVLEHIAHVGEKLGEVLACADISLEIYGQPSAELQEAAASLPSRLYSKFQGVAGS